MSSATQFNISTLPRISRDSLAAMIKSKHPSMAVIDVRDSDYIGGHITGGQNLPSNTHDYKMPELIWRRQGTYRGLSEGYLGVWVLEPIAENLDSRFLSTSGKKQAQFAATVLYNHPPVNLAQEVAL
ncbi:hypothetical protein KCV07_g9809, partial [Aureobasidium melanogenum]